MIQFLVKKEQRDFPQYFPYLPTQGRSQSNWQSELLHFKEEYSGIGYSTPKNMSHTTGEQEHAVTHDGGFT